MNSNTLVLLRTLLLSTSRRNIFKHCKDKKKRGKIIGNTVGMFVLYAMLISYSIAMSMGYGAYGLADMIPATGSLSISLIAFFFTLLKTNGYLFNFREYDMLMSLPFEVKTVAGCKFLYMYVKNLPWVLSISLSMLIGYSVFAKPSPAVYPVWIILTFFLPVIPMLVASFIGFLIARISAGFRKTNLVQTIITFAFVLFFFALRFIIEDVFRDDKVEETFSKISESIKGIERYYPPAAWFDGAVLNLRISDILLLVGVTVILFELIFIPVGKSYREINSRLKNHASAGKYKMTGQKQRSVVEAIAFKEFRRMTGSTTYMVNAGMGFLLVFILGIAALFVDFDKMMHVVLQDAPVTKEMLYPALPFIVYFFVGMVSTTAMSPSLEGKNYWIVQSLPITKEKLCQGKMLFNLYLTVPASVFATFCFCISAKAPFLIMLLSLILGILLCVFSTVWGACCGYKHMRLDWENEVEVIKQGSAVALYMFPNMFINMGLIVLAVFLGTRIDRNIVILIMIPVVVLLSLIFYKRAIRLARKAA